MICLFQFTLHNLSRSIAVYVKVLGIVTYSLNADTAKFDTLDVWSSADGVGTAPIPCVCATRSVSDCTGMDNAFCLPSLNDDVMVGPTSTFFPSEDGFTAKPNSVNLSCAVAV